MVRIGFFDFVSALKLSGFSCLGRGLQQCRVWTTLKGFSLSDNKGMFSAWCRVTWGQASRSALSHYIPQTQLQVGIFPQNLAVTPISLVVRPCTRAQRIVKCKKKKEVGSVVRLSVDREWQGAEQRSNAILCLSPLSLCNELMLLWATWASPHLFKRCKMGVFT